MNKFLLSLVASTALTTAAFAQESSSVSGSGAEANSGSIAGSESNGNVQGQQQQNIGGNNAGIGNSTSRSDSNSDANSASNSFSGAASDQTQAQGQSLDNRSSTATTQTQGQSATQGNQQGVSTNITFNSTNRKHSYVGTNTPVYLAASSSFSSDYCGGTVSGGASVAPIGVSIGGAGTKFDNSCRYLRLAEKAGMLGANYYNMQQPEMAMKAMSMMSWAVCMAGPQQDRKDQHGDNYTMEACLALGLLGQGNVPSAPPEVTPPEVIRSAPPAPEQYESLPPKTPRGENITKNAPAISAVLPH